MSDQQKYGLMDIVIVRVNLILNKILTCMQNLISSMARALPCRPLTYSGADTSALHRYGFHVCS